MSLGNLRAAVFVERTNVLQEIACRFFDGRQHRSGRDGVLDDHSQVTVDAWEARQRPGPRRTRGGEQRLQVDLERDDTALDPGARDDPGMELAQVAKLPAVHHHGCAPAWMEELGGGALIGAARRGKRRGATVEHRLQGVEGAPPVVSSRARRRHCRQAQRLLGLRVLLAHSREVGGRDLVEVDVDATAIAIEHHGVDQRRNQRGTQRIHVVAQGVGDAHRVRGDAEVLELASRHECGVPGLGVTEPREHLSRRVEAAVDARCERVPGLVAPSWQRGRHAVVAIDAPDLLDQVLRNRHVEAEHRRQHIPLAVAHDLDVKVETFEDRLRLLQRHVGAEHSVDERGLQVDADGLLGPRVDVGPILVHGAAGQLGDQRRGATRAGQRKLRRKSPLETRRRFGAQADRARCLAHVRAVEGRRLEKDVGRL